MRTERQQHAVVARRGLQLEVEGCAEPLSQREPERAVDTTAERSMHDQLHAAAVVEEPLQNDVLEGRHDAERGSTRRQVAHHHRGNVVVDACSLFDPCDRFVGPALSEQRLDTAAKVGDFTRQLLRSRRGFPEPERNGRWCAVRIHDTHGAGDHSPDLPRRASQQEDVPGG